MAEAHSTQAREYNEIAVSVAARLAELRAGAPAAARRRTREQLFGEYNTTPLGIALEYERMGNQPVSDALQARADALGCRFEHLGVTLGTVLHGVDLKAPGDELIAFIRATLLERKVIFFRDQNLSEDQQVAFGRAFGELDAFPFGKPGNNPFIVEITHGEQSPGMENGWHTDVTWMEQPSLGSIAQLIEAPPVGGDTLFSDSHAVYLGMPGALRDAIQELHGVHDYRVFLAGRGAGALPEDMVADIKSQVPFGVSHPLCRTHPETGKTALYIHGGFLRHDSLYNVRTGEALPKRESEQLVRQLLAQHGRPETVCRFKWAPGSIAFWDNRAVQHYAASDYWPHRRLLRRVTVSGDAPFYDPARAA